jgi:hypothetical protein
VIAAPFYWRAVEQPHDPMADPGVNAPLFTITGVPGPFAQPLYLPFAFLDPATALAWSAALSLAVAGVGMAVFLLGKQMGGGAAFLGAVVYAFGGMAAGVMSRPGLACVLAWSPWVLAAAHALASKPNGWRAIITGFTALLALLGGAVAAALPALGMGVLVAIFAGLHEPRAWQRSLLRRLGALLLAALTVLVLGFPAWWLWRRYIGETLPMAAFAPREWPGIVTHLTAAATNDLPHAGYLGVATLLLAPAALTRRGAWLFFALYGAGWAGAQYGYPPEGWFVITALCGAAIAGFGASALLAPMRDWRSPFFYGPLACAVISAAALLLVNDAVAGRAVLLLLPILLAALFRAPLVSLVATVLLALITTGDLAAANRNRFPHPYFGVQQQDMDTP